MIGVFAGSAPVTDRAQLETAAHVGGVLAQRGEAIVYGGGCTGLMGALANAALAGGGQVIGVVPRGLFAVEQVHAGVSLIEVESLHARKQIMLELADAFIVLPGGFGTLDEISEVISWAQLGIHDKVTVFIDPTGYWSGLFAWIDEAVARGYVHRDSRGFLAVVPDVARALTTIEQYVAPPSVRALTPEQA